MYCCTCPRIGDSHYSRCSGESGGRISQTEHRCSALSSCLPRTTSQAREELKKSNSVGVFRLNEAMKNDTVGGRNAYSPKSSEALSWSATSRAHLGNSIPGEILDVRRVFIPRGTNDLRRDAGRIPEVYYLKELFLFRDIYINSLVCACSVEGSFRGWFRAAHGRVMMIGLLAYCIH